MMKTISRAYLMSLFIAIGWAAHGFSEETSDPSRPVAKIGATVLTEGQMQKELALNLYEAENSVYQVKKNWIEQQAKKILFDQAAKEAGVPRAEWEKREIDNKAAVPTQQEIDDMLKRYPSRDGAASTDTIKRVTQYLTNQKKYQRESEVYKELQTKSPLEILVAKPAAPHIDVAYAADDPVKGKAKAPITILEFTDFQCPYCQHSQDTLREVEKNYPDTVKLVARQYPLPMHSRAKPASEAALCAKEQGKFWEFRDKLFEKQQLEDADFKRYAKELKLNEKKFDKCLSEHRYAPRVDTDVADGQRFGVRGTPHFFVNGRPLNGAQPFNAFKEAIEEELARKR